MRNFSLPTRLHTSRGAADERKSDRANHGVYNCGVLLQRIDLYDAFSASLLFVFRRQHVAHNGVRLDAVDENWNRQNAGVFE